MDSPGDKAVTWLATSIVIAGGIFTCCFMILVSGPDARVQLGYVLGCLSIALTLIWLLQPSSPVPKRALWTWKKKPKKQSVNVRIIRPVVQKENVPPTPDTIRDAKESLNTWVPNSSKIQRDRDLD